MIEVPYWLFVILCIPIGAIALLTLFMIGAYIERLISYIKERRNRK